MAEKVGAVVSMPRIALRQGHRSNIEASSACEYFQRNVAIPILDHIIMGIDQQFSPSANIATSLLGLVPSVLFQKEVNLEAALNTYNTDLPSPELFHMELKRWKNCYTSVPADLRPASPAEAIKDCDPTMFPNISVLLQICCTIPVTSCECERSFSTLRHLNNYMRASMGIVAYLILLSYTYTMTHQLTSTGWWIVMPTFIPVGLHWSLCFLNFKLNFNLFHL